VELSDPEDQALLGDIYVKRSASREEAKIRAAQATRLAGDNVFTITLALVPSLGDDPNVSARVIRRKNPQPRELILLPEGTADVGSFGAALSVLMRDRAKQGTVATQDVHIDIRGSAIPKTWDAATQADANKELEELRGAKVRNIPGVGRAKTTEILARCQ